MDAPRLRVTHPQKYYFKIMCKFIHYLGFGDYWYEKPKSQSKYRKAIYLVWAAASNSYVLLILLNEILAFFRPDLNDKEKHDLIHFSVAHPTICAKIIAMYLSKNRIRVVLERLLEGDRPVFSCIELERACIKRFVIYCIIVVGTSYVTVIVSTIDGIRAHYDEGIPIRIEVTLYPSSETGHFVHILRFFIEFHWWFIVAIMVTIDCLALCSLLTLGTKFKVLQIYFENLKTNFIENAEQKSQEELEEEFRKNFVIGIQLHEDALWCARNLQHALGNLYNIQVFESVSLIAMCLLKLVAAERNLVYFLANFAFIACLILLTGCYMMAAGDITHEASLVSTAVFHSGWELVRVRPGLRVIVVMALQRSQAPVHMMAFQVIALSYSNFISVLRSSYSFFAIMY